MMPGMPLSGCERRLDWAACLNVRDLGGFTCANGCSTRWRRAVRADNPVRLSSIGLGALIEYGIRTVIDLRATSELRIDRSPFESAPAHAEITYLHCPLFEDDEWERSAARAVSGQNAAVYIGILQEFGSRVVCALTAVARAGDGAVLFHCHSGKDRTGIVSALLLDLVGVSHDAIAADYALSSPHLEEATWRWIESDAALREARMRDRVTQWTHPEVMHGVLNWLSTQYGGAKEYLLENGMHPTDIAGLRARLAD